ncbi:MAG TPA: molybdopterin converting factor subunit 1 [Chromatiales bacterium]|nr:molybdopterin converting factor subunit 1 [Chromatiales bacterium]
MITVKYFASLREQIGRAQDRIHADGAATVREAWIQATGEDELPEHLLMAVNLEYAGPDAPVRDGDEVAFFPPVTGG